MELNIEKQEALTILSVIGRLDTSNYMEMENLLPEVVNPNKAAIIDCSRLDYISSSGLRVMLLALKKSEQLGAKLALCGLQPSIHEIFRISAFDKIFSVYQSREEALSVLSNK